MKNAIALVALGLLTPVSAAAATFSFYIDVETVTDRNKVSSVAVGDRLLFSVTVDPAAPNSSSSSDQASYFNGVTAISLQNFVSCTASSSTTSQTTSGDNFLQPFYRCL
ncbi:hypothetical protein [Roseobacter sp.]|uniref:hypothetical protein n=1 Tax=Roseobacter sp. TaxID=1907202 RepID=UPI0025F4F454|nr:hypothetical protein [Roseobacter sp.]